MSTSKIASLAVALVLGLSVTALAGGPHRINYQGILTDSGGQRISGAHTLTFKIYPDSIVGVAPLWMETINGVTVTDGVFNVILGPPMFADTVFSVGYRWMGVYVDADSEMVPRTRITSVPWALRANFADSSYTKTQLNTAGTINSSSNPVDWTRLKNVPAGFADGVDDGGGSSPDTIRWAISGNNMYSALSGNVGIGTTSPQHPLDVEYTATTGGLGAIYGVATQTGIDGTYGVFGETKSASSTSPGTGVLGVASGSSGAGQGVAGFSYQASGVGVYGSGRGTGVYGVNSGGGGYAGYFTGGKSYFGGNVGLGVTAPSSKLEVADNQDSKSAIYAHASGSGSAVLTAEIQSSSGGVAVDAYHSGTGSGGIAVRGRVGQVDQYAGYFDGGKSYFSGPVGIGVAPVASAGLSINMGEENAVVLKNNAGSAATLSVRNLNSGFYSAWFVGSVVVDGDLQCSGEFSKGSGSFVIDHPLDPENKLLRHNFVESPENLLIYRGQVRLDAGGAAMVRMPDYFKALTKEEEATVTLTSIGKPFLTGYDWIPDHSGFTAFGDPGREVSWVVYADRDDPVIHHHARPVEEDKGPGSLCDRGKLLYPAAYGYPETRGAHYEESQQLGPAGPRK